MGLSLTEFHHTERIYVRSILTPPNWWPKDHVAVGIWYNSGFFIEYKIAAHRIPVAPKIGERL